MNTSLYEKYGGFSSVSKVVHEFYRRVLESELLSPYFAEADMQKLVDHQVQFFSTLLGGPVTYDSQNLNAIHQRLGISETAFDEVLDLLAEVLEDSGFSSEDLKAVIEALNQYRPGMVAY